MREKPNLIITGHCAARMRQRGYQIADLETIESLGTPSGDGIVLRTKDVAPELEQLSMLLKTIRQHRSAVPNPPPNEAASAEREIIDRIQRLRRLAGTFIPLEGGQALSIYRPCERRLKHLLRDRRIRQRSRKRVRQNARRNRCRGGHHFVSNRPIT
jgi:hypothetical protein